MRVAIGPKQYAEGPWSVVLWFRVCRRLHRWFGDQRWRMLHRLSRVA